MTTRKSRSIPRSLIDAFKGNREIEFFFREVGDKTISSSVTIDELSQIFYVLNQDKLASIEYRLNELERKISLIDKDELDTELEELRRMSWLLPPKS